MRLNITLLFLYCLAFFPLDGKAQNITYARTMIDSLTSSEMHGRGYVHDGHQKAANYIAGEFNKWGLKRFNDGYLQQFPLDINTFPGNISLKINDQELIPGKDFIVTPNSSSVNGTFQCSLVNINKLTNPKKLKKLRKNDLPNKLIIADDSDLEGKDKSDFIGYMKTNPLSARGVIVPVEKLTHGLHSKADSYFGVEVMEEKLPSEINQVSVNIENSLRVNDTSQNVIGYIEGKTNPDSFVVFTAHYDHLGRMGKNVYFPGANDNASGTAMIIDLARHYSLPENRPEHSVVLIAFGAEEAGLIGSRYFTENPLFDLNKVKFLINLDIVGTGDEGITVVNSTGHPGEFDRIAKINEEKKYLSQVKKRGQTQNSDHYFFSQKGVPAFFIYTMGGIKAYHDIYDRPETLPLTEYEDLFRLLTEFADSL